MLTDMDKLFRTMSFKEAVYVITQIKGLSSQHHALAEECAELIVASSHRRRGRIPREKFLEELVDVQQMIDEFKLLEKITSEEFSDMRDAKDAKFLQQIRDDVDKAQIGSDHIATLMDEAKNPELWWD
jgi:predicted nucleic acid-binding protein